MTGVFAGETEAVHAQTLEACYAQYLVPVQGQADILVSGIPYISPYNVNSFLNPLLVQVMAQGYLFNLYRGAPLVKKGGTMIIFHPCTDQFDQEHHAPYIEFVHDVLPQTRDAMVMHKQFEAKFATNPAYIEMYRTGHAYHPAHPFFMWYWGEAGRQHLGRVIVVGADNEYIPKLLGYETAERCTRRCGWPGPPRRRARDPRAARAAHRDGRRGTTFSRGAVEGLEGDHPGGRSRAVRAARSDARGAAERPREEAGSPARALHAKQHAGLRAELEVLAVPKPLRVAVFARARRSTTRTCASRTGAARASPTSSPICAGSP